MSEHPTSNELIEQIRRAHASACPKPTENPAWTNCHVDCGILLAELDRQRAEIERLRDTERKFGALMHDVMDERDRLRAALGDILHYQGHLNSNVQVDMQSIARNALRASPFETKARRMTRAEADAMNRAFWRSVEIIDDIDDREEVAPGDARYYRPSENTSICPYGQSDCETTRGGVCQCAMPAEQAFDGRD